MRPTSRREVLRAVGSATSLGLAGCFSGGSNTVRYQLSAHNVPGSLADAFRWEPRGPFAAADRELMGRLIDDGSLTTEGFALYPLDWDGRYVERNGTYYETAVERTGEVTRERWILWFDLIEGDPPADAEVFTSSLGTGEPTDLAAAYGLSERDVRVVEDAAGQIPREGFDFQDPEDDPPGRRGHVFLRRGPDQTALLPDPPFTHVAFETDDRTWYARVVTERATVALRRYEHTATAVAESTAEYVEHLRDRYLEAAFDRRRLPDAQRDILDTITAGGGRYEERQPRSDALTAVLTRLGLAGVETPESKGVEISDEVYFSYHDGYYTAELQIFR